MTGSFSMKAGDHRMDDAEGSWGRGGCRIIDKEKNEDVIEHIDPSF